MQLNGNIKMMETSLNEGNACYYLPIGDATVDMNALVGESIELTFNQIINCANCGK